MLLGSLPFPFLCEQICAKYATRRMPRRLVSAQKGMHIFFCSCYVLWVHSSCIEASRAQKCMWKKASRQLIAVRMLALWNAITSIELWVRGMNWKGGVWDCWGRGGWFSEIKICFDVISEVDLLLFWKFSECGLTILFKSKCFIKVLGILSV